MRFATLGLIATLSASTLAAALPAAAPTEFFLVTTNQSTPSSNSSELSAVSATTFYVRQSSPHSPETPIKPFEYFCMLTQPQDEDPVSHSYLLIRLLASGYNSLPNFTLADGTLSTLYESSRSTTTYNSSSVTAGQELQLLNKQQSAGNIDLKDGYLLTVDGEQEGWTICRSQTGQQVLAWKGTDGCRATYVQAVDTAPYKRR